MPRDRSNPWDNLPHDDEPTETAGIEEEPTAPPSGRRAARQGSRVNLDETNVGGSLLPDDLDAFSNPFAQAGAPAFAEPAPAPAPPRGAPPVAFGPPPEPEPEPEPTVEPESSLEVTEPRYVPTPLPNELADEFDDDLGLGPVEEFTISGLLPDELDRMRKAAVQASRPAEARRPRRDDPDPGITGVAGFESLRGPAADEEETVAAKLSPETLRQLGRPAAPSRPPPSTPARERSTDRERPLRSDDRHYNTFGAGLQRLDELPSVDEAPPEREHSVGGILELLDQGGDLDLGGDAGSEGPAPSEPEPARDRPRRVRTRRAGSRSTEPEAEPAPEPLASLQRSASPAPAPGRSRTSTPGPVPSRGRPPLQKSDARKGRSRPSSPLPIDTAPTNARAADEEARIRAALAAVGDDEQTSWVKLDGEPAAGALPPAAPPAPSPTATPGPTSRAGRALPGKPPAPAPPPRSPEPSLTMHLEQVPETSGAPTGAIANEETTVRRALPNIGDEATLPTADAQAPIADEETRPVPVPSGRPTAPTPPPPAAPAPVADAPTERPPAAAPPKKAAARPPTKAPGSDTTGARKKGGKKPPVEIGALGDDKSDTYRDPAIAWLLSILTVFFLGAMLIVFLILLLYLI